MDEDACFWARRPEFVSRNPHVRRIGRREVAPAGCPLTLLCTLWHTHTHTHDNVIKNTVNKSQLPSLMKLIFWEE